MRAKRHKWTAEQARFIREFASGHTRTEITNAINEKFGLTLVVGQIKSYCGNNKIRSGMKNGWKKTPEQIAKCSRTQFKKGESVRALPVGSEIEHDDCIFVKVKDELYADFYKNWKRKQRLVWEQEHGEIPEGCVITFLDGDTKNCDINNLECCTLKESARITNKKLRFKDRELTRAALNVEKVISKIEEREGK